MRAAIGSRAPCDIVLAPTTCGTTREGIGRIRAATAVGRTGVTLDASDDGAGMHYIDEAPHHAIVARPSARV